jgi:hypothetical protein
MNSYPEKSLELIVSEVKKAFELNNIERGSIFLNRSLRFGENLKDAVKEYQKEGILNHLFNLFKLEDIVREKYIALQIFSSISSGLMELNMLEELKNILKEFMNFIRSNPYFFECGALNLLCFTISNISNSKNKLDLSDIDFEELFEILMGDTNRYYFENAYILLTYQTGVNKELIHKVIDALIEILDSHWANSMKYPLMYFTKIVKLMKLDFKPWMPEIIKFSVERITELLDKPNPEVDEIEVFNLLSNMIAVFRDDCEIYISKFKFVPLLLRFLTPNHEGVNQIIDKKYSIRILIYLSFYKSKSLEGKIDIIIKNFWKQDFM